jgi:hypothetical protein
MPFVVRTYFLYYHKKRKSLKYILKDSGDCVYHLELLGILDFVQRLLLKGKQEKTILSKLDPFPSSDKVETLTSITGQSALV